MLRTSMLIFITCLTAVSVLYAQNGQASSTPGAVRPLGGQAHVGFVGDTLEVVRLTTLQAAQRANRVLYVQSTANEVKRGVGGNIFTYTTFKVIKPIKGQAGSQIQLRLLGGRIDNEVVPGPLELDFTPGDRFVLFFGKDNAEGYPTLIPQAVYAVKTQDGVDVVDPSPTGLQFFHARDARPYSGSPAVAPLEDFMFSLERVK
jgi:hypothetical protein